MIEFRRRGIAYTDFATPVVGEYLQAKYTQNILNAAQALSVSGPPHPSAIVSKADFESIIYATRRKLSENLKNS